MGLKKISFITGFAFCLFSLALLAEGKKKNGNKESAKAKVTQVQAQESQTPGTTTAPSTVIATVGNTKLTYGELQAFKKFFAPMGAEEERLINFWKLNAALAEKARKENIDKNPEAQAVMQIAWDQVMGSIYIRYKQLQVSITDQEVKEYYNQHQNDREFREN
jgi:hypothetical protein